MTRTEVYKNLDAIFADVFDDEDIHVSDETVASDISGWDSLEHINLMLAIENGFGMKFSMAEVAGMKNVGEMVDVIMRQADL